MNTGRIISVIFGLLSVAAGFIAVFYFASHDGKEEPQQGVAGRRAEEFVGRWVNENPQTGGPEIVEIERRLNRLSVAAWGEEGREDNFWGEQFTHVSDSNDGLLEIKWDLEQKSIVQDIEVLEDGRLKIIQKTDFPEAVGKPTRDDTFFFKKG